MVNGLYLNREINNIFIINNYAGNKKGKEFSLYLDNLPYECKAHNLIINSQKRGDIPGLVKYYSNIYRKATIYSVGGDGTLNEVVNGMNSFQKLAIIPTGTGNDFYRVYKEINGTKKIDIGMVNGRKFINLASVGLDAKIARDANIYKNKNKIKIAAYPVSIIKNIIKKEDFSTSLGDLTLLAVANGKYYGNGIPLNPFCNLNDGLLDVYKVDKIKRLQILKLLLEIYKGTHANNELVDYYQTDHLTISSDTNLIGNVDGEVFYAKNFEFKVIPKGLTVTTNVPVFIKDYVKTRIK